MLHSVRNILLNIGEIIIVLLVDNLHGKHRIDKFLSEKLPNYSRSKLQCIIKDGHVFIDNLVIKNPSFKVTAGQMVNIYDELVHEKSMNLSPEKVNFNVLYEDDNIIVIDKPAGVVVHPGAGNFNGTLVNGLLDYCENLSSIGQDFFRPGIVHRIDKGTSGILVVAKDDFSHAQLSKQFAEHTIVRKYICFVYGVPKISQNINKSENGRYTLQTCVGRDPLNRKKMKVLPFGGKNAITIFKISQIYKNGIAAKIECELKTGRTHQVRVHMNHLGSSIIGDDVYGRYKKIFSSSDESNKYIMSLKHQLLHAYFLDFQHPVTGKRMMFTSNIPDDMMIVEKMLSDEEV